MLHLRHLLELALLVACSLAAQVPAPPPSPVGLQGEIRMTGSDSMDPLLRLWVQGFKKHHPGVTFKISSHGSGTAVPALVKGEADLGHMSREMTPAERAEFKDKLGHEPQSLCVAHDALAVFVNRRTPLRRIRLEQLDAIYSETRLSGWPTAIRTWRDLAGSRWRSTFIRPYTRDEKSGSRAFFMEHVLQKKGVMRQDVQVADQMGILDGVAQNVRAIGYGPAHYLDPKVQSVALAAKGSSRFVLPSPATIQNGTYPLTRRLFICLDRHPDRPMTDPVRAFLDFVLSEEGQQLTKECGAVQVDSDLARTQAAALR